MYKIILYTNENCPECKGVRALLNSFAVYFEEKKATENAKLLIDHGFISVPILQVDDQFFSVYTSIQLLSVLRKFKLIPGVE